MSATQFTSSPSISSSPTIITTTTLSSKTVFDLFSNEPLPKCDIIVAADVLYNEELATQIGRRCLEALKPLSPSSPPPKLIVTDSQNFHGTDFLGMVNGHEDRVGLPPLVWEVEVLANFTGSGVMIEEDQLYDVTVRTLSTGWGAVEPS